MDPYRALLIRSPVAVGSKLPTVLQRSPGTPRDLTVCFHTEPGAIVVRHGHVSEDPAEGQQRGDPFRHGGGFSGSLLLCVRIDVHGWMQVSNAYHT